MTIGDWMASRVPRAPDALGRRMLAALGNDARADESRLPHACLSAAQRALRDILAARRFGREGALDLLAADALATLAYEYASGGGTSAVLGALADEGLRGFGATAGTDG